MEFGCGCMNFFMKWYDFRGIDRIFWSQHSHWIVKKKHFNLIISVGFDFDSNIIVGSLYIRWKSF